MKAKRFLGVVLVVAMICSLFVASAVTASAAEIIEDGLIGWYKLDGDLTNSADSTGDTDAVRYVNSAGGSAFDGTFWDDDELEWATAGVDGSAYRTTAYEGFATLNPGNNDFTVSFWMAIEDYDYAYATPFMWYGEQDQSGYGYNSGESWIGIWNLAVYTGNTGWGYAISPAVSSNDTADSRVGYVPVDIAIFETDEDALDAGFDTPWVMYTISCVLDEETNTYTISYYINGEPVVDEVTEATSVSGFPNPYTGDAETYGDYIYFQTNYWDGGEHIFYDDILIYNVALTADEVATNYAAYTVPSVADLLESVYTNEEETDDTTDAATEADDTDADTTDEATEADGTDDANTTAGDSTDAETEDSSSDSGCGSALGAAAVIMAVTAVFGCAVVKKK
ncbi:MAG: LamG domain-containing protein [Clostridia bacterium]|nr:LamG domain-containing protein [Clostridia bacterium]